MATDVQTAFKVQDHVLNQIQEMARTPFMQRTMYPISTISERFDKLEKEITDKEQLKKVQTLRSRYIKERMKFNQELYDRDRKAERVVEKFHKTRNHEYVFEFDKICVEIDKLYTAWNVTGLNYKLQQMELGVFGDVR